MPNVTFFFPGESMPDDDALARLTDASTAHCTDILKADVDKVHVIYVAVRHGRGRPAFVEVRYRLDPSRTPETMDAFMEALDGSIQRNTGITARIRCFGYAASAIQARN